ncbi:MAG: hypothetical protein U9O53_00450 [archaeon]|nr:hypothetical protein [archaeon]
MEELEYTSGDTLRLVPVFFKGLGVTDSELDSVYRKVGKLYPGSAEGAKDIQELLGSELNIISTSWDGFLYSMNDGIVHKKHIYGTSMNLDSYRDFYGFEKEAVISSLKRIAELKEIVIDDIDSFEGLKDDQFLDYMIMENIFWNQLAKIPVVNEMYHTIRPIGSKEKAKAVMTASEKTGIPLDRTICVGDSSTDRDMLELVREEGGITWTHNGKNSILDSADFNLVTADYYMTVPLVAIANRFGKNGLILLARDWTYDSLLIYMEQSVGSETYTKIKQRLDKIFIENNTPFSRFTYLPDQDKKQLASLKDENEKVRRGLRGEAIAGVR